MLHQDIVLNNGERIPAIGFGVFMVPNNGPTKEAVKEALQAGYRLIDTAAAYQNESDVGEAVRESGIPRKELYITSKLWMQDYGYTAAKKAIDVSLHNLEMDYMDLYLLHQPYGDTAGAWKALEEAVKEGKIKSIGLSNHSINRWKALLPAMTIKPAINQMECNPFFQQKELRAFMGAYGTRIQAWFPFGHGDAALMTHPVLQELGIKYGKNVGQIILRFDVQEGIIALPKSTNPERIKTNLDVFDFYLTDSEMAAIKALDTGKGTYDPDDDSNAERLAAYNIHD